METGEKVAAILLLAVILTITIIAGSCAARRDRLVAECYELEHRTATDCALMHCQFEAPNIECAAAYAR